jgi:hypothetical protein
MPEACKTLGTWIMLFQILLELLRRHALLCVIVLWADPSKLKEQIGHQNMDSATKLQKSELGIAFKHHHLHKMSLWMKSLQRWIGLMRRNKTP